MSEQPRNSEVNPNEGDGSTSDPNWHGDAGDQGNDLRFAEEQQLINSQARNEDSTDGDGTTDVDPGVEGEYTEADSVPSLQEGGDAEGAERR